MKVLVTGGHLSPASAVIDELLGRGHEVVYVGPAFETQEALESSDEYPAMQSRRVIYESLQTGKLHRYSWTAAAGSLLRLPIGVWQAMQIVERHRPAVIFSVGSYLGPPIVLAGRLKGIPSVIHEQTHFAGLGNKLSANLCDVVAVSFEDSKGYFPADKVVYTGNPVRLASLEVREQLEGMENFERKLPTLYITGGHLGMLTINMLIVELLPELLAKYNLIHSIGTHPDQAAVKELFDDRLAGLEPGLENHYIGADYFGPAVIGSIFDRADVVISRSGANICTELAHWKKPSLLIPLISGQKQEQQLNAELLSEAGLAQVLEQKGMTAEFFAEEVDEIVANHGQLTISDDDLERLYPLNAAERLADILERYG